MRKEEDDIGDDNTEEGFLPIVYRIWERSEFYVFLVCGAVFWYFTVFKLLDWHKFPVHMYPYELWMVVIVPVLLILVILYALDWSFSREKAD